MLQITAQTNTLIKQCYVQDFPRMSLNNIYNTKRLTIMVALELLLPIVIEYIQDHENKGSTFYINSITSKYAGASSS